MALALPFPHRFDWRGLLLVAGVALVGTVSFQGSRGLYETTEGRYAECARETMASGDYDDPILNGLPHWTKPPLTYMAIMAGMRTFGNSPWGVRAYLVAAMVLAAGAVWRTGTCLWGSTAGIWAGLVFATSPVMAGAAHVASADMLTVLWVALAIAAFWHGHLRQSATSLLAMWLFLGLGFMTKGPPALLVPATVLPLAAVLLRKEMASRPPSWLPWVGLGLFLLVGVLWYVAEAAHNAGLLAYWLGDELVGRNVRGEFHRNPGLRYAFTIYLPLLLLGTGPWLPLVLLRGRPLENWWRTAKAPSGATRAARLSLLAGVALPFAVFSLSQSKMPLYLAPLFVPLSLLLGRMIDVLIAQGRLRARTAALWAGLLLGLIVAGKGIKAQVEARQDMTRLAAALAPVLAREGHPPLYTATGRPLNGLEFHLDQLIESVRPRDLFAHMEERIRAGEAPRYVVAKLRWEQVAGAAAGEMPQVSLGPNWLLLSPPSLGDNRPDGRWLPRARKYRQRPLPPQSEKAGP